MKRLIFALFLAVGVSACNDDVVSFGQQTATKIQTENQTLSASFARVYIGVTPVNSGNFSFDGEFIIVDSTRYNLNRLVSYRIFNSSGTQTLALYF